MKIIRYTLPLLLLALGFDNREINAVPKAINLETYLAEDEQFFTQETLIDAKITIEDTPNVNDLISLTFTTEGGQGTLAMSAKLTKRATNCWCHRKRFLSFGLNQRYARSLP